MSDVTREDLDRIHDRVDTVIQTIGNQNERLATVITKLEMLRIPVQPCSDLKGLSRTVESHISEHSQYKQTWKTAIINGVVRIAIALVIAVSAFMFGKDSDDSKTVEPIEPKEKTSMTHYEEQ
jgi:uncharacterized membrane protein